MAASWLIFEDAVLGSELGAVARTFDDDLVSRVGQAIQSAIVCNTGENGRPFGGVVYAKRHHDRTPIKVR
jgi:hypothetical protein